MKYRVWAKMTDYLYADVEANSKDEAIAMGEELAMNGEFKRNKEDLGDFQVEDAVEIENAS